MQHPNGVGPEGTGVATGELAGDMSPERQMAHQASGGGPGFFAREISGCGPLTATEGTRCSRPGTLLKQHIGVSPSGSWRRWRVGAEIRRRLETIHPNPGPAGGRGAPRARGGEGGAGGGGGELGGVGGVRRAQGWGGWAGGGRG